MILSIVAAHGLNYQIGLDDKLPWYCPEDLKHFKALTMGKTIVMGRKTFESVGILPGRRIVVLSRDGSYDLGSGILVANSLSSVIELYHNKEPHLEELMIVGGGQVFKEALPLVNRLHITLTGYSGEADTFFPQYLELDVEGNADWKTTDVKILSDRATYIIYDRIKK